MSEKREIIESHSTKYATISLRSDGITEIRFIEEYELVPQDVYDIQDGILKIGKSHPLYILVIPGPLGGITREARDVPMFKGSPAKAIGIVTKMIHQRILGNLYFKFKKEEFSNYKMLKTEALAEAWLIEELAKES